MKVYIIGMPGTGKTHFGRLLSRSMRLQFYDTDEMLEKKEGMPIRQIVSEKGEPYFRLLEHELIRQLSMRSNCIISCGGGTPVFNDNIDLMKNSGIVIWLNTSLDIIAKRIAQNVTRRPQFVGLNEAEIRLKLNDIFEKRKKIYAKADIISEISNPHNKSLNVVIQKVMKISQRRFK